MTMKLLTPIFLLISFTVFSQNSDILHIDSLPTEGVLLDKGWKWHAGDNPDWAKSDFDDAAWESIDPTKTIPQLNQVDTEKPLWLRLNLTSKNDNTFLASVVQSGATEIFLNGKLIAAYGQIENASKSTVAYDPLNDAFIIHLDSNRNTLAVRYYFQKDINYNSVYNINFPLFSLHINNRNHPADIYLYFWSGFNVAVPFLLFIIHFIFFLIYTSNRTNFWYSLANFFGFIGSLFLFKMNLTHSIESKNYFSTYASIPLLFYNILIYYTIYLFLKQRKIWMVIGFAGLSILALCLNYFDYFQSSVAFNYLITVMYVITVTYMGNSAWKQGQIGGLYLIFGMIAYIISWTLFILSFQLGWESMSSDILFHIATLIIPIIVSVLLGLEFKNINNALIQNLQEVNKLSTEKQHILAIQNETLEKQVHERTAELEHKNRDLEIEGALEKIRSASLAMHHSDEIESVVSVLFEKLKELGLVFDGGAAIHVFSEGSKDAAIWVVSPQQSPTKINLPYYEAVFMDNPIILDVWHAKETGNDIFNKTYSFEEKNKYFRYVFQHNDYSKVPEMGRNFILNAPNYTASFVAEKNSLLGANSWTGQLFSETDFGILKRVAKVFEQAYTRFLDLQKAEAQTREVEIEIALEKIRSRTLAMHKSDELKEVSALVREKLKELNVVLGTIAFWFFDKETMDSTFWVANDLQHEDLVLLPYDENTIKKESNYKDGWQARFTGEDLINKHYNKTQIHDYFEYVFANNDEATIPPSVREFIMQAESHIVCLFVEKNTILCADSWTGQEYSAEMIGVLKRATKVFEQAYVRFLDLQKAEAQAREAQIEAALERVRSKTMAMHKSEQLAGVMSVLCKEILHLGIRSEDMETCYITTFDPIDPIGEIYLTTSNGDIIPDSFLVRYDEDYYFKQIYAAWKNGNSFLVIHAQGEELRKHFAFLYSIIAPSSAIVAMRAEDHVQLPTETYNQILFFSQGYLDIVTRIPVAEYHEVFKRFGNTLQQAYTRFLDLQKAEAQAREAQIEAALERVRSASLAIHQSHELENVVVVLFDKLKDLGITFDAAFIYFFEKSTRSIEAWVASKLLPTPIKVNMPYDESVANNPIILDLWNAIENGEHGLNKTYKEKDKDDYYRYEAKHNPSLIPESVTDLQLEAESWTTTFASEKNSIIGFDSWNGHLTTIEDFQILKRFAKVFEQAYIRFLDLQKAEAQAREAQIEAALERVRSRTMAMHKSNELTEVINVVAEQLLQLNFQLNTASFFLNDESEEFTFWLASIGESNPDKIVIPKINNPALNNIREAQKNGVEFWADNLSFEEKNTWFQHVFAHSPDRVPEDRQKYILNTEGYARSVVLMKQIGLFIVNYVPQPYTDAENAIFKRFAFAFGQAYTRFLDLQKAEAQVREAQIEAALEKVRSRAMAMQKSEELSLLIGTIYTELIKLDVLLDRCLFMIFNPKTLGVTWWMGSQEDTSISRGYYLPYHEYPTYLAYLKGWQERQEKWRYVLGGEEKRHWDEFVFAETELSNLPKFIINNMKAVKTAYQLASFQNFGGLVSGSLEPLTDESLDILRRFAKVFDLSYTRFNDLKQAEAQAKEAQIELALERVRAKTMAMQKSQELREVAATIFEQLQLQGFNFGALAIVIMDEISGDSDWWISGFENDYPEKYKIPFFNHRFYVEQWSNWKEGKKYAVMEVSGEEKKMYDDYIFSQTDFIKVSQEAKNVMCGFEKITFSNAYMKHGALSWGTTPISGDDARILQRFATVFEQTYTRFLDLKLAEEQAREAQIEVALERIRSKTLAMQSSDVLSTIIGLIYSEMGKLNVQLQRCFFMIFNPQNLGVTWWMASGESLDLGQGYFVPYSEHPPQLAYVKGWQERQETWRYLMQGEEKAAWDAFLFQKTELSNLPSFIIDIMKSFKTIHLEASFNSFGCLTTGNEQPLNQEAFDLLIRFSKVFDMTYTRFNDIKIAEAQAEQARLDLIQIQTEKKRAEDALSELRITQTQLIQKEKLASLGELTAGIAHEIQNPLNFVNNFSELSVELIEELKSPLTPKGGTLEAELLSDISQNLEKINHHGKRASSIVKGMLEHSRASTGVKEWININKLADEYLRLSYHGLRAKDKDFNADFSTDFDVNLPKIEVIPQDIGRVLLNLINNAFYAVNQRKQQLDASSELASSYTPSVIVYTQQSDSQIIIKIKDNGIGMSEATKAKVFQPFFTTKPTGQGTGLGLSLAYDIVTKGHGGTLEVESEEGEGSIFIIQLPM